MVKKKKVLILTCIITALLIVLAVVAGIFVYKNRSNSNILNVFDEMIENGHAAMEDAERVTAGGFDAIRMLWTVKEGTPLRIGIVYSMEYKKLYIYGDACMPEEIQDMSYQEYFEECLKEYGITWEEVEDSKEDFICKNILGTWFTEYESSFTKNMLGELEVLDFLMPYEYCGKDNSEWITVAETVEEGYRGAFNGKVQYTVWDTGDFLCRQTQKSRDYGYHDIMERIEADINGLNTVSEDIKVEWYCRWHREHEDEQEYDSLADVFDLECYEFVDWLQAGGEVKGNLTKLSYTREEGEAKTREMLEQCSGSKLFRNLEVADYYIAGNELNIRLAYYDYEAENPDWVENGKGEIWQGWITVKIDDVREFLGGNGFYIERAENWKVNVADGFGYLYKDYDYYDYIEKYYHVLEYSISTVPRDDYHNTVLKEYLKEDIELSKEIRNEHPGESPLMIDYHMFDFNDDGIEDYLVCMHESEWSLLGVNMVRIYIQEKNGTLRCVFEEGIHLHDRDMEYSHAPVAVLEEKTGGYYIIALPEEEILLRYNEESGKYEYDINEKSEKYEYDINEPAAEEFVVDGKLSNRDVDSFMSSPVVLDFLAMDSEDFENKYDRNQLYDEDILYCDMNSWQYQGTQLDGFSNPEDYDVTNIVALRYILDDQLYDTSSFGNSNYAKLVYVHYMGDYVISMYFRIYFPPYTGTAEEDTAEPLEISCVKVELAEGATPKSLYQSLEDDYYDVRERILSKDWIISPEGNKEICVMNGALPKHPAQIFVRYREKTPDTVFRFTCEQGIAGWIDEEHIVCYTIEGNPYLIHLETNQIEDIEIDTDDYDFDGAKYEINGNQLIAKDWEGKEEVYHWNIVEENHEVYIMKEE